MTTDDLSRRSPRRTRLTGRPRPGVLGDDELDILSTVHPDVWAEQLTFHDDPTSEAAISVGDCDATITLRIDEPLEDLPEIAGTAKRPFRPTELARLEEHRAVWRLTMPDVSDAPLRRAYAFAKLVTTAVEAGAPGVFFPFCLQLHSPSLITQLAVDFSDPPAMVNLFVNAWNDDEWMITRGLTVFGFPEVETRLDSGLNDAFFRLMDVAAGMLMHRGPFHDGARLELGPHIYRVEPGPSGPRDTMVPICGAYGRMTLHPE